MYYIIIKYVSSNIINRTNETSKLKMIYKKRERDYCIFYVFRLSGDCHNQSRTILSPDWSVN